MNLLDGGQFFLLRICRDFGQDPKRSTPAQREALEAWLVEQYQANKTVVVFVDEAQRLSTDQLELVRTLLNFETAHHKLLQLVLAGQLDLRDRILAKRNKALRSRIYSPCMMVPLSRLETDAMIAFRCERAGVSNPFQPDAIDALYELSGGVPRQALLLAGHAANFAQRLG